MALLLLVLVSLACGLLAAFAASRWPRGGPEAPPRVSRLARRMDPEAATGLALSVALLALVGGGVVLAVLTLVLRADPDAIGLDARAAAWGDAHARGTQHDVIEAISYVGRPGSIVVLAVVLGVVETLRTRSRWVVPFLVVVLAGNGLLTTSIKHIEDRVRPALNPVAETLGPSFPSGHSSWSAAFFAAAALLFAVHSGRSARIALAGAAVGLAVGIAATRVLLAVHWVSDVVGGLALGWAWFAACAVAFGGRLLRFGAGAERAAARASQAV